MGVVILSPSCLGRVAEWQTRWLQVPVSFGTWGFKSPFAHSTAVLRTAGIKVTNSKEVVTFLFEPVGRIELDIAAGYQSSPKERSALPKIASSGPAMRCRCRGIVQFEGIIHLAYSREGKLLSSRESPTPMEKDAGWFRSVKSACGPVLLPGGVAWCSAKR